MPNGFFPFPVTPRRPINAVIVIDKMNLIDSRYDARYAHDQTVRSFQKKKKKIRRCKTKTDVGYLELLMSKDVKQCRLGRLSLIREFEKEVRK